MRISDFSIDRSTTVLVLLVLIVVMGLYSFIYIPRESEPEIVVPLAMVTTVYEGVSPADIETLVTMPIERKLTGISGVEQITSTSTEGLSTVVVEFQADVDVNEAVQKVRDKVDAAQADLPDDAEEPVVADVNTAESPVMQINLTGPFSLLELTQIAEDLQDDLESLSGVLEAEILGDVEREIRIIVDPARTVEYGVSLDEIARVAAADNVNVPAGSMDVGEGRYAMRVPGEITRAADLNSVVIRRGDPGVVYLRDLAEIEDDFKEVDSYARLDLQPSVSVIVKKRAGVDIVKLARDVEELLDTTAGQRPPDLRVSITLDESERIYHMVWQLQNSILTGLFLVFIVIFLFLGVSNAFFVALAIPVSMLITFVVMYINDMTLNMVTLFSLMVALGMLVDNGIVVVENIYRYVQMDMPRVEAAKKGASEVAWPIIGSTLTTVAAFFPLIFWPGMMGNFLSLLPKTVIITLFASLFVGLVVNPALASIFVRRKSSRTIEADPDHPVLRAYGRVLRTAIRWPAVTLATAIAVIVSITGVFAMDAEFEFLSEIEPDRAHINIEMAEGTNLDTTDTAARTVEDTVRQADAELDYLATSVGSRGASVREGMPGQNLDADATYIARVSMVFPDGFGDREPPSEVVNRLRGAFDDIVGAEIRISKSGMGPPQAPPVNIELSGDDFGVLAQLAEQVKQRISGVEGLVDLYDDLEKGKPEVRVIVDREQAKLAGLNTEVIGRAVQAAVHGRKVGEYRVGDDEYDVTVTFPEWFREDVSNVRGMAIVNTEGYAVPFTSVAKLEYGAGPGSIRRIDRKRTMTVIGEAEGRPGQEVLADVKDLLADMTMPPGYSLRFTGEDQEVREAGAFMTRAFGVALLLIALVLITQFNSLTQPLIIMSSVIMSFGGVFLGLIVFDMPFGFMMTGIGCISLSGIVVNNAIVLVDFINTLKKQGMAVEEAIVRASKLRFRPVLLTAVTTVLGLLPLGLGISFDVRTFRIVTGGDQSSYWGPMAVAIIFGLSFATVLTLVVVPTLYNVTELAHGYFRRRGSEDADTSESTPAAEPVSAK